MKKDEAFDLISIILRRGLFPLGEFTFHNYQEIIVDLDSYLSIVLKEDFDNLEKAKKIRILHDITGNMIEFLETYIDVAHIKFYYNMEEYKIFSSIYPNWCKDRQKRFKNESTINTIHKFLIEKFRKLSTIKHNFHLIKSPDSPIIQIFKDISLAKEKKYIIISRDPHYLCLLAYFDLSIYNGRFIVGNENYYLEDEYPKVSRSLIPAYYMIAGLPRNEYKGLEKYGKKNTVKLINNNIIPIIKQELELIEPVNKYRKIFYLKEL